MYRRDISNVIQVCGYGLDPDSIGFVDPEKKNILKNLNFQAEVHKHSCYRYALEYR
jgi:hypothetical protein